MPADPDDAESPAVAAFLRERRTGVLQRAIATLDSCPTEELAGEAHRLAGTLGVFGLDEASTSVRELMNAAQSESISPADLSQARSTTLETLGRIADQL